MPEDRTPLTHAAQTLSEADLDRVVGGLWEEARPPEELMGEARDVGFGGFDDPGLGE